MRDILIGLLIILGVFLIGDFIYSNNNVCKVEYNQTVKCGFLKKQLDIDVNLFNRYW